MIDAWGSEDRGIAELPTTKPLPSQDTRVLLSVIAGAFVVRVAPLESKVASRPAAVMGQALMLWYLILFVAQTGRGKQSCH